MSSSSIKPLPQQCYPMALNRHTKVNFSCFFSLVIFECRSFATKQIPPPWKIQYKELTLFHSLSLSLFIFDFPALLKWRKKGKQTFATDNISTRLQTIKKVTWKQTSWRCEYWMNFSSFFFCSFIWTWALIVRTIWFRNLHTTRENGSSHCIHKGTFIQNEWIAPQFFSLYPIVQNAKSIFPRQHISFEFNCLQEQTSDELSIWESEVWKCAILQFEMEYGLNRWFRFPVWLRWYDIKYEIYDIRTTLINLMMNTVHWWIALFALIDICHLWMLMQRGMMRYVCFCVCVIAERIPNDLYG